MCFRFKELTVKVEKMYPKSKCVTVTNVSSQFRFKTNIKYSCYKIKGINR